MADSEAIDLYADVDDFGQTAAAPMQDQAMGGIESDLYDAMITSSAEGTEETNSDVIVDRQELIQERRCPLYVGNLTWWTSDQDLIDVISSSGVTDIIEIKFHENRTNGQSKGYATVVVGSEGSMHTLITKLPKKELHGKPIIVTLCTKQNQKLFDDAAPTKQKATNGDEFASGDQSGVAVPSSSMHRTNRHYFQRAVPSSNLPSPSTGSPGMMVFSPQSSCHSSSPRLHVLPHPSMMMMPGGPGVVMRGPPPTSGIHGPPGMVIHQRPDWNMGPVNAFSQRSSFSRDGHLSSYRPHYDQAQSLGMSGRQTSDRFRKSHHSAFHRRDAIMPQISETEFEEVLQKNRNISSGAISRANEDAAAGDFPGAIETLVTAISLIWQSKIAEDERCKTLISALQDTLQGIEQRSYTTKALHNRRSHSRNHSDSDSDEQNSRQRSRSRSRHRSTSKNCTENKGSNHSSRENSTSRDRGPTKSQR